MEVGADNTQEKISSSIERKVATLMMEANLAIKISVYKHLGLADHVVLQ